MSPSLELRPENLSALPDDLGLEMLKAMQEWPAPTVEQVRNIVLEGRFIIPAWHRDSWREVHDDSEYFKSMPVVFEEAIKSGRLFDLGFLPNTVIVSEAGRAATLFHGGHIGHPFRKPYCIFHRWEGGGSIYAISQGDFHHLTDGAAPEGAFMICEARCIRVASKTALLMGDAALFHIDIERKGYSGMVIRSALHDEQPDDPPPPGALGNLVDPVMTALLLLNTDGVPVDRIPAPEKLNKQRAKHLRPLIPAHWRVNTDDYVTALTARRTPGAKHALGGHHSSPVPHLRRGHSRHLHAMHGGGTVWIRDAVVNLKNGNEESVYLGRSFYQRADKDR